MSDRPVIGIAAALETASYAVWNAPCALIQMNYVEAVQRAGGMAILIPYDPELISRPDEILARVDGLMLTGGADIDPSTYAMPAHPETSGTVLDRDAVELALAERAFALDLPVLGICRGMQVLNVARGGTLVQHLPEVVGHQHHRRYLGTFEGNEHDVQLDSGSLAASAAGASRTTVKSHHHQAIDRLGDGLVISGRSILDELPEAIEAPDRNYVLGVQWHPEADEDSRIIASLVASSRAAAATGLA